jgi:hypothetical protein
MASLYYMTYEPERAMCFVSAEYMAKYPWISSIVILHTDTVKPDFTKFPSVPKTQNFWKFFGGNGINNADGINEVDARNTGVMLATLHSKGDPWIMQCDSDELFIASPDFNIAEIEPYDGVLFEQYHFVTPNKYRQEGLAVYDGLIDPHVRLWRKSLGLRHDKPAALVGESQNPTAHTHFDVSKIKYLKMQQRLAHVHFHDLTKFKWRDVHHLNSIQWDIDWPPTVTPFFDGV